METFEEVALDWFERNKKKWSGKYQKDIMKWIQGDDLKKIREEKISEITLFSVLDSIREIEKRGVYEPAKRQLQLINRVMRYAVIIGKINKSPGENLHEALTKKKGGHYASLSIKEIPDFLKKIKESSMEPKTKGAFFLLLLTFVRTNEMMKMRWDELDWEEKVWRIPAHKMKMRREHLVPLSDWAIEILLTFEKDSDYVFTGRDGKKPMSNNTLLMAIQRMGYQKKMTGHGFRSLAMTTIKERLGWRHEVIDRQLAHSSNRAYDRADFFQDRVKMMNEWSSFVKTYYV